MCNKIESLSLDRVKGNTKQVNANVRLDDGKQFTVRLSTECGEAYINPMKVFREFKRHYPNTRLTLKSRLFKTVTRSVVTAWEMKYRRASNPAIRH